MAAGTRLAPDDPNCGVRVCWRIPLAVVVVGGHSRNTGKTSVVAGIIAALADRHWTAVKLTQYGHGICSLNGRNCHCTLDEHRYAVAEETDRCGHKDTSWFLVAGAVRSLWVRVKQGQLGLVMPELWKIIESAPYVIVESNSILNFVKPDLYLSVLRYDVEDFKDSAREMLARCDAAVIVASGRSRPGWAGIPDEVLAGIPTYPVAAPEFVSADLINMVRARLG